MLTGGRNMTGLSTQVSGHTLAMHLSFKKCLVLRIFSYPSGIKIQHEFSVHVNSDHCVGRLSDKPWMLAHRCIYI